MFSFFLQKYLSFFYGLSFYFKKHIFTTAAIDNIDHNPTTTTVTASLHGTSILPGYSLSSLHTLKIVEKVGYNMDVNEEIWIMY